MQNARTPRFPITLTKSEALRIQSEQLEHYAAMFGQMCVPSWRKLPTPTGLWTAESTMSSRSTATSRVAAASNISSVISAAERERQRRLPHPEPIAARVTRRERVPGFAGFRPCP